MSQEPALFATSIKENILLGRPDADQVEIEEAARVANAHSFIIKLPDGFDTQVWFNRYSSESRFTLITGFESVFLGFFFNFISLRYFERVKREKRYGHGKAFITE